MKYRITIAAIVYKTISEKPYLRYEVQRKRHWYTAWESTDGRTYGSVSEAEIDAIGVIIPNDKLGLSVGMVVKNLEA